MQQKEKKVPSATIGRGGIKEHIRRRYEEQLLYLEGEADYLELTDPIKYVDMVRKRRTEATRIRRLIEA